METIATAATVLVWPTLILILISFALWIFSWSRHGEEKRAEKTFKLAGGKGTEDQGTPRQPGSQEYIAIEPTELSWAPALVLAFRETQKLLITHPLWLKMKAGSEKLSAQISPHWSKIRDRAGPYLGRRFEGLESIFEKSAIVLAIVFGLLLSYVVGAKWLYSSMVGSSYSNLYIAYCKGDAVTKVLSNNECDQLCRRAERGWMQRTTQSAKRAHGA